MIQNNYERSTMKNIHLIIGLALFSFSCFASAKTIVPSTKATAVSLKKVEVTMSLDADTSIYNISATAIASNSCSIPRASELYFVLAKQTKDLSIVIAKNISRACPRSFDPKEYTIYLGKYSSKGGFDSIVVNGKDETP